MTNETATAPLTEDAYIQSMEYEVPEVVITVYERYQLEYIRLKTLQDKLAETEEELDEKEEGRLDLSQNALRLMRRHYANALLHMRRNRNRNNTDQPTCSSSGDQ